MFNRFHVNIRETTPTDLNLFAIHFRFFCLRQQLFFKQFHFNSLDRCSLASSLCPIFLSSPIHPIHRAIARAYLDFISWLFLCDNEFSLSSVFFALVVCFFAMQSRKWSNGERISSLEKEILCQKSLSLFASRHPRLMSHKNEESTRDKRKKSGFYETLRCLSRREQRRRRKNERIRW